MHRGLALIGSSLALAARLSVAQTPLDRFPKGGPLVLRPHQEAVAGTVVVGTMEVAENPRKPAGRRIPLHVVVLPAKAAQPLPDPVVFLAGGPGQAATTLTDHIVHGYAWLRAQRDIVLVDQRGTGKSNPLVVPLPGSAEDPQGYVDLVWRVDVFAQALADLEKVADLTQYTTAIAMDDLDAVRAALGYERINLMGGSYGTRAALPGHGAGTPRRRAVRGGSRCGW
jgi:pimeloyl-ACP methyl ester carboxylesterase